MHCPSCGHHNALRTRFCAECGTVLVEDVTRKFARRVLPRVSSPEAPVLLESASRSRTAEWSVAACIAISAIGFYVASPQRQTPTSVVPREFVPLPVAAAPRMPDVQAAAEVEADASIDAPLVAFPAPEPARVDAGAPSRALARTRSLPRDVQGSVEPADSDARETPVEQPPGAETASPTAPRADRWVEVQREIDGCGEQGLFERVICVERVRHASCEGHWGQVPLCPGPQVVYYIR